MAQHRTMIEQMARTIREEKPSNMEDLERFVASTEQGLSVLNDEVETLKQFQCWPSAKLDRFKEAAALYKELNKSIKVDSSCPSPPAAIPSPPCALPWFPHCCGCSSRMYPGGHVESGQRQFQGGQGGRLRRSHCPDYEGHEQGEIV